MSKQSLDAPIPGTARVGESGIGIQVEGVQDASSLIGSPSEVMGLLLSPEGTGDARVPPPQPSG